MPELEPEPKLWTKLEPEPKINTGNFGSATLVRTIGHILIRKNIATQTLIKNERGMFF